VADESPAKLLDKVLRLERSRGCQDRATTRGMAEFTNRWLPFVTATAPAQQAEALSQLADEFKAYAGLSPSQRASLVDQLIEVLQELTTKQPDAEATEDEPDQVCWDDPVTELKEVGSKRAGLLATLSIYTVGDLLLHCPLGYEDRSQLTSVADLKHRERQTLRVAVAGKGQIIRRGKLTIIRVPARDETGQCTLVWFNQPYRANMYSAGTELVVTGSVRIGKKRPTVWVEEAEQVTNLPPGWQERLVPYYAVTTGLSQTMLRRLITQALSRCRSIPAGLVPANIAKQRGQPSLPWAVAHAHSPTDADEARQAQARLIYERLFALQAALAQRRHNIKQHNEHSVVASDGVLAELSATLPFTLTQAQQRVIKQVLTDLAKPEPQYRLIHGDVGSGKTVVAAAALLAAARAGRQAAMMAPTEVLAEQDWAVVAELLEPFGIKPTLLIGSSAEADKQAIRAGLASGEIDCVVGTHALFQKNVEFADLAVVVIDEQQRFGVAQRARLAKKGHGTNILVMSATPIPRTLALTAYGDFDVSVVDELPPGRQPVHTELLTRRQKSRAYETVIAHIAQGRQAFIVCPVIEEAKTKYVTAAEELFEHLSSHVFPTLNLGLVHGQMPSSERETVMAKFRAGEIDVLVATSVVEVGVDVPNATVMLVQNAERFGLAQLHQLRGRVGRGSESACCLLVTGSNSPEVIERLNVLVRTNDGFKIASEDLARRGPGELAGTRQHGLSDPEMSGLLGDTRILIWAREDALKLIGDDPRLEQAIHQPLKHYLTRHSREGQDWTL